jgi:hypothetical protein
MSATILKMAERRELLAKAGRRRDEQEAAQLAFVMAASIDYCGLYGRNPRASLGRRAVRPM